MASYYAYFDRKGHRERKERIANASDYLETWDDSDSITAINAQNDLRHPAKMVA